MLGEPDQLDAPFDRRSAGGEVLAEDGLGLRLGEEQQERKARVVQADVEQGRTRGSGPAVHLQLDGGVAPLDHGVGKAEPAEHLQRPRLDGERPGLVDPVELAVDEPEPGAERLELRRQGQAGRAGADDQDVDRFGHRSPVSTAGLRARTKTDQKPSATGWLSTISMSVNPAPASWDR